MYAIHSSMAPLECASQPARNNDYDDTWGERFIEFHNVNPHVYQALVRRALDWNRAKGDVKHIGLGLIWELARADLSMEIKGSAEYRLNDAYRSYYARLMMNREPELEGKFRLRKSDADDFFTPRNIARCK